MRRFILFCLFNVAGLFSFSALPAHATNTPFESQAQAFVVTLINEAFGVLRDRSTHTQAQYFDIMGKILAQYFAINYIANFALGANGSKMNTAQQQEYITLFQEDALLSYATLLSSYSNEDLKVLGTKAQESGVALVSTILEMPDTKSTINIDWRVRQVKGTDKFYVIDVLVAGVSLSQTKRSEFDSAIHNYKGDMDKFLKSLNDHIAMLRRQKLKGFKAD